MRACVCSVCVNAVISQIRSLVHFFYQIPTVCYHSCVCHNTCETECIVDKTDHHSSVSTEMLCHDDSFETVLVESCLYLIKNTARVIMFSVITNIYNKKTKRPTLMVLFTATGKLKKFLFIYFYFLTTSYVRCVHHG